MPDDIPETVTRVDVVDQNGVHEFWGDRWEVHVQDDGRTVKLIQRDGYGAAAKAIRDVALAKDLSAYAPFNRLAAELKAARAEEQQWCDVAQKAFGVGTPSMLESALKAARAEVERLRARCEPQVYVTTPPCSEYGEGTRGEVRHPIGRCGDPNCGGDW